MQLSLARIKKWNPVRVGIFVGFGLWAWVIFQRLNHNENFLPFYERPYIWLLQAVLPQYRHPGQSPAHPIIFLMAMFLSMVIYYAVLGALLGFLFQWLLWMFRRLKRHDAADQTNSADSANAPPPTPPPGGQETKQE